MIASHERWRLVTTFNYWGDGSAVESATQWASALGYGRYLDALHNDGLARAPAHPVLMAAGDIACAPQVRCCWDPDLRGAHGCSTRGAR